MRKTVQSKPIDPTLQAAHINRRGALITAVCGVIAALITAYAAYAAGRQQGADTAAPPTVTVEKTITATGSAPAPASAGGSESASASDATQAASAVSAQIQLDAGTGVDIDAAEPHAVEASGPNGDLDLYISKGALAVTHSALFSYYGKESDAVVGCPKTVANDRPYPGPIVAPSVGGQFCLRTSKGTIGWFNINDGKMTGGPTDYLVINYQLFD